MKQRLTLTLLLILIFTTQVNARTEFLCTKKAVKCTVGKVLFPPKKTLPPWIFLYLSKVVGK